jgi:hypothetical protein
MDSNVVVALVSIAGVIVGMAGTYFVQKMTLERQRKWALEDEGRSIKRELMSKRLDVIEEASKIMRNEIGRTVSIKVGLPMSDDGGILEAQVKRLQSIRGEAYSAVLALDYEELTENYSTIIKAYQDYEKSGTVNYDLWAEAHKAYVDIISLTDEMRSQV